MSRRTSNRAEDILHRRRFLQRAGVCVAAPSAFLPACNSGKAGIKTVAWLETGSAAVPWADIQKLIRTTFETQGFAEGRNLSLRFEDPWADTLEETLQRLREIVRRRPDVIVQHLEPRLLARLTKTIPVVFYDFRYDPVESGFVESLARPGTNFTGVMLRWDEVISKKWQLLKDIKPSLRRGAALTYKWPSVMDEYKKNFVEQGRRVRAEAAAALGIEITEIPVALDATAGEIADAVARSGVGALELEWPYAPALVEFVHATRLPTCGDFFWWMHKGGTMVAVRWREDEGPREAAFIAARILSGESPATIPVHVIRAYEVGVNAGLARHAGITIPPSVMVQAVEVVP